jgi:hypothetical protein
MAFFRFAVKSVSRSARRSAPAAAAYRAGERIRDERTGALHNYRRRQDVTHKQILLPAALGHAPDWVLDRSRLWNEAEAAEQRRDSRVAREYQLALPHELDEARRLSLAQGFAQELADRHGVVVDLCLHNPKPEGDPRNYHAHLLVTTRQITAEGLGAKTGLELRYPDSLARGLLGAQEYWHLRERWAIHSNDAYRRAGLEQRVEHLTLAQRGLQSTARRRSFIDCQIERRRMRREILEGLAERYRERVAASTALGPQPYGGSPEPSPEAGRNEAAVPDSASSASVLIEEARRRGREAWLAQRQGTSRQAVLEHDVASSSHAADDDLAL